MKFKPIYLILAVVIIGHFIAISCLKHNANPNTLKEEVQEQVGQTPKNAANPTSALPSIPEPAPEPLLPTVPNIPYNDQYFAFQNTTLPADIQKLTACCKGAIAVNLDRHIAYWQKDPLTARPIASVTKMMTALVAVEKMLNSNGEITPETPIKVTREASKIGGRQIWLDPRETFTFTEILKATLVHSANDCAYLLGEFMGNGNIASFIKDMDTKAKAMGCTHFTFYNTHGLTEQGKDNLASPAELAYLAEVLLNVPEITRWTCVKTEYIREKLKKPTMLSSSNTLLGNCQGVNGMKTGYTDKAGFCIVATCERNGRHVAVVILGAKNRKERDALGKALINWLYTL